jgi:O-antigen/teichoic acid export membrane protein
MSRVAKNIIYNLVGQGLLLVLGFVTVKYVFTRLGADALGIIYFTMTLTAVLSGVLEMGICSTVVREVSAYFQKDPIYIRNLIRASSLFYWSAYIFLAISIYLVAPFMVKKWILLKTIDAITAIQVLEVLGIAAVVGLPRSLYASLFRGLQRMEFNNLIDVGTTGVYQLGTILILLLGGSLLHIATWFAVSFGLSTLAYLILSAHFFSWKAIIPGYTPEVFKRNIRYSWNMMSISILVAIQFQADKLILSKLLPLGTFGYYSYAYGVIAKPSIFTAAISQALFPSFSTLASAGDEKALRSRYNKFQELVCLTTVPLFAAVPFAALPVFTYIFNADVAKALLLPVTFLAIGFYMNGTLTVPYIFSLAVGKPEITVRFNFLALFIVLPVMALLIYFFGLTGAGFSLVFYHLVSYGYAMPRVCFQCLEIPVSKWYAQIGKIFGLAFSIYGFTWGILIGIGVHTVLSNMLAYVGATAIFLFSAYFISDVELRAQVNRLSHELRLLLGFRNLRKVITCHYFLL